MLRRLLKLVLAVFVTGGLVLAPLVAPAAKAHGTMPGMTGMSMAGDMACCPDQSGMDCQDCPLMAICILQTVQASAPSDAALPLRYAIRTVHRVHDDAAAVGLDRPPPDHPPRT